MVKVCIKRIFYSSYNKLTLLENIYCFSQTISKRIWPTLRVRLPLNRSWSMNWRTVSGVSTHWNSSTNRNSWCCRTRSETRNWRETECCTAWVRFAVHSTCACDIIYNEISHGFIFWKWSHSLQIQATLLSVVICSFSHKDLCQGSDTETLKV